MNTTEIITRVNEIFKDVLDNDEIIVNKETTANDVEEWDSLSHIQLIVEIEKQFGVKFTASEIRDWKTVGEMADCIAGKL